MRLWLFIWCVYRPLKFLTGIPHLWRISGDRAADAICAMKEPSE